VGAPSPVPEEEQEDDDDNGLQHQRDRCSWQVIHSAAKEGNLNIIHLLLNAGLPVDIQGILILFNVLCH
jgi:hypothetical protein